MEEVKIRELSEKSSINTTDSLIIEDEDGTKKVSVKHFRSLVLSTLYFNSIKELKESSDIALREGDICKTLGYYEPGDGGGSTYVIKYDPAAVDDGMFIHNLAYSDTLRAEIILNDTINVHQFGAKGDGSTDDSKAIQTAIDNSASRIIEFSNGKKYCIKNTIIIKKSNTIINGNGATLYPLYIDGINITTENNILNVTNDVVINKLHFDCSRAISAIKVFRATKIDISGCTVDKVTDTGIDLTNCTHVTIDKCHLTDSGTSNHLICINGQKFEQNTPSFSCKFIDIEDTKFNNFYKAIDINSSDNEDKNFHIINITNCSYYSTVNNSYCIYMSCPVDLLSIDSQTVTYTTTFLFAGGASGGKVSCKDISCLNTIKVFDIGSTTCMLRLDGSINTDNNTVVFEKMNGKVYSNIMWESLTSGASFNNKPTGEISDLVNPYNYTDTKGYNITNSKLTINEARNMYVNWSSSTNNLNEIVNGIKGQLMFLRSSTNKSIIAVPNKIVLSESSIKLGTYYGVMLKFDGLKWTQISNLTTISALSNSITDAETANGIFGSEDTNTTYTLLKEGKKIILAGSDGNNSSVDDDNTTYTLSDFGITATPDEINKLSGSTFNTDEINILNGLIVNTDELNFLYGIKSNVQEQIDSKAPIYHADTTTKYGLGNSNEYGHVKVLDSFSNETDIGSSLDGIAASQLALHEVYRITQEQIGTNNTDINNIKQSIIDINTSINETINTEIANINKSIADINASINNTINTEITNIKNGATVVGIAKKLETARNIQTNLASTSKASFDGSSDVTPGVTGILPVANGGTGKNTLTSGAVLIGNGTGAVATRTITNNTSTDNAITANTNIPTMNTLKNALNRTTSAAAADTNYTTVMVRGIAGGTSTPPSSLPNGALWVKYS